MRRILVLAAAIAASFLTSASPSLAGPPCRSDVGGLCGQDYNTWHNNWNRGREATNRARQRVGIPLLPRTVEADDRRYGNGDGGYPVQQRRQGFAIGGLIGQLTGLGRHRGGRYGNGNAGYYGGNGGMQRTSGQSFARSENVHREYHRQGIVQGAPVQTVNEEATAAANVDAPFPSTWEVIR